MIRGHWLPAWGLLLLGGLGPAFALGQGADAARIEQCRQAVLACQLPDGAVVAVPYRELGRPALVEPYFAHLACCGVLAAEQIRPNAQNRAFVNGWLKWYARRQKTDRGIFVLEGKRGATGLVDVTRKAPDSIDAYAGLYLYVAGRHAQLTRTPLDPDVAAACVRMLETLESCHNQNDLFWNFPLTAKPAGVTPAEYLLDNVEVHQGLTAISGPLATAGYQKEAARAEKWATKLGHRLGDYWSPRHGYYVCMFGDRAAQTPFGKQPLHAEGLATVTALGLFNNMPLTRREALWRRFQTAYAKQLEVGYGTANYPLEEPTIERVYLAAVRAAPRVERDRHRILLRARVDALLERNSRLGTAAALTDGNPFPFCHRFGLMLIALASPEGKATPYLPGVSLSND
ncbi:MAG: hypothetical protein U0840_02905 [Gemmataceae bacterium]